MPGGCKATRPPRNGRRYARATSRRGSADDPAPIDRWSAGDYVVVVTRAGVAELKANLSAYLRRVRDGETITVMDRNAPVAKLVSVDAAAGAPLRVRPARAALATLEQPRPLRTRADVVELLLEERGER